MKKLISLILVLGFMATMLPVGYTDVYTVSAPTYTVTGQPIEVQIATGAAIRALLISPTDPSVTNSVTIYDFSTAVTSSNTITSKWVVNITTYTPNIPVIFPVDAPLLMRNGVAIRKSNSNSNINVSVIYK